jgi:hypothetical protein
MPRISKDDIKEYLQFHDWIETREFEDKNWIVVARILKKKGDLFDESFFTFSVLARINKDEDYNVIFSTPDWGPRSDLGYPIVWDNVDGKIEFDPGDSIEIQGILYKPFIILRNFHLTKPEKFEIIQNFILFHNLYFAEAESTYRKLGESGEEINVILLERENGSEVIKINANYLRDYLYFCKMVLLRQHDHKRFLHKTLQNVNIKNQSSTLIKKGIVRYDLVIANTDGCIDNIQTFSRIHGKDIIRPLSKPDHSIHDFLFSRKFEKFVIGLDDDGNTIEDTCNEKELKKFLKPIYFKKELLKKYYDNPSKYRVDGITITCLSLWYIEYAINESGLIQVYLGDLGKIPFEEQRHWRQFNVPPEGGIPQERIQRDFFAEFVESTDPVDMLKQEYELAQKNFKTRFGFQLHTALTQEDSHCYLTLHIPVTDEQKEFDEQVLYLAKILIDSISKGEIDRRISSHSDSKSIESLRSFLTEITDCQGADVTRIIDNFSMIQGIRSSGAAHSKGTKFGTKLEKYGLAKLPNNVKRFEEILNGAREALAILSSIHKKVRK